MESKKVNRKRTSFPSRGKRTCEEVGEREEQRDEEDRQMCSAPEMAGIRGISQKPKPNAN